MSNRIVTVFGGSGFLGRHLIQQLAQQGALIRVAVRRPEFAGFLRPMGGVGQVTLVQANVRNDASVAQAIEGANEVVNLTGILYERSRQRFGEIHSTATFSHIEQLTPLVRANADVLYFCIRWKM